MMTGIIARKNKSFRFIETGANIAIAYEIENQKIVGCIDMAMLMLDWSDILKIIFQKEQCFVEFICYFF
jgi:hypothetical protein